MTRQSPFTTVFLRFSAHVPISERTPLLEYRCTKVNCNIYDIDKLTFLTISQNRVFSYMGMHQKEQ